MAVERRQLGGPELILSGFPTECADRIREVIFSGMKTFHTLSHSNSNNSWFNHACYTAVYDEEEAYRRHQSLYTIQSRNLYVSALNCGKSILCLANLSFESSAMTLPNLSTLAHLESFWHLA